MVFISLLLDVSVPRTGPFCSSADGGIGLTAVVDGGDIDFSRSGHNQAFAEYIFAPRGEIMDLMAALRAFVRVTETGSFSAVARDMHLSQSAVTRLIAQLEQHFSVRLFHRTTRRLSLTDDGQALLAHARHLIESADEMEAVLGRQS